MTDASLEPIADAIERSTELADEEAIDVLRTARRQVRERRSEDVDEDRRRDLETQIEQRLREVGERDRYDGGMGSAMNPDDADAP